MPPVGSVSPRNYFKSLEAAQASPGQQHKQEHKTSQTAIDVKERIAALVRQANDSDIMSSHGSDSNRNTVSKPKSPAPQHHTAQLEHHVQARPVPSKSDETLHGNSQATRAATSSNNSSAQNGSNSTSTHVTSTPQKAQVQEEPATGGALMDETTMEEKIRQEEARLMRVMSRGATQNRSKVGPK